MKHVLVIGGWDALWSKVAQCDVRASVFLDRPKYPGDGGIPQYANVSYHRTEFQNLFFTIQKICDRHQAMPFAAVFVAKEEHLLLAGLIRDKLGIKGLSFEMAAKTKNKVASRRALDRAGLGNIGWCEMSDAETLRELFEEHRGVIVKPVEGVDSRGVRRICDLEELSAVDTVKCDFIAEEYIDGDDYSVESVSVDGKHHVLGVTSETNAGAPYFYEIDHFFPAPDLAPDLVSKISERVKAYLEALGIDNCISHTEIRIREDEVYFIETHPRVPGDRVWRLLDIALNVDPIKALIRSLCGEDIDYGSIKPTGLVGIRGYVSKKGGTIERLSGVDEARSVSGVVDVIVTKGVGDALERTMTTTSKPIYVLAQGQDRTTIDRTLDQAFSLIKIKVA